MAFLRSCLFFMGFLGVTAVFGLLSPLMFLWPYRPRYYLMTRWAVIITGWLKISCGLRYEVEGLAHIPSQPVVILSKHQSTFETIVFQEIFPPFTWIMKRELLWLPFFGWGLATFQPIQINRSQGIKALKHVLTQGKQRLKQGLSVLIFPEGTRTRWGEKKPYRSGGAALAKAAGVAILPVTHNAGQFWPRGQFTKHAGVVKIKIGAPISTENKTVNELTAEVELWIETHTPRLDF
jgi:1-acyl-sn-glycerol-3-phosphate acyltransferase